MSSSEEEMRGLLRRALEASQQADEYSENTGLRMTLAKDENGTSLVPDNGIPALFFNDGPDAAANITAYIRQDLDPALIEDYAAWVLRQEVPSTNGIFDLQALVAWQERYASALAVLPGFHRKLQELIAVSTRLAEALAERDAARADFRSSPMQLFLDHDSVTATRMLFSLPNADDSIRKMLEFVAGNSHALEGLRNAVTDYIVSDVGVSADNAERFSQFLSEHAAVLTLLFEPEQMLSLRAIEADMRRAALSLQPQPKPAAKKTWFSRLFH